MAVPFVFALNVKNNVIGQSGKEFKVKAESGQTLLQAMQAYQQTNPGFQFKIKDDANCGTYLDSVNGTEACSNQFWISVLDTTANGAVKPIDLNYKVNSLDNIYLMYMLF